MAISSLSLDPLASSPPEELIARSRALGADRSICNEYGGNTSTKVTASDHTGRRTRILWVKGSGSDLAAASPPSFTGLRLDELVPLLERPEMSDDEMVAYLARCQLSPEMPRGSIETLLHAFLPAAHVDHTHADAINWIACSQNGEAHAAECFGDDAIWIPYRRPGFELAKEVGEAVRDRAGAKLLILAKHGLVTWGETSEECTASTKEAIERAGDFVERQTAGRAPFGGVGVSPVDQEVRRQLLIEAMPALRGAVSDRGPRLLRLDVSDPVVEFVCGKEAKQLASVGAACPDHLVHTRRVPLWVDFDPQRDDAGVLVGRIRDSLARYREETASYVERFGEDSAASTADLNPRVVLLQGIGMVTIGRNASQAELSAALYHRAISVMRGAHALDAFISLDERESFEIEFWPLELFKLTLAPAPLELEGRVALVTGAAGGIGSAIAADLAGAGATVIAADIDAEGATGVIESLPTSGQALTVDVTDESAVSAAFEELTLAFGGLDIVVSNAGAAASAPIEQTSVETWDHLQALLGRAYFLVARNAFALLRRQGSGGSVVFIASKNGLVAGRNAAAYSAAKALELHLARCLAEEGGSAGIRVNTVNPDAVLDGSKIWDSAWRQERAAAYGIAPEQLESYYRDRTGLKTNVLAADVARAVRFFASSAWSAKTTGNMLNVDGGIAAAYPR